MASSAIETREQKDRLLDEGRSDGVDAPIVPGEIKGEIKEVPPRLLRTLDTKSLCVWVEVNRRNVYALQCTHIDAKIEHFGCDAGVTITSVWQSKHDGDGVFFFPHSGDAQVVEISMEYGEKKWKTASKPTNSPPIMMNLRKLDSDFNKHMPGLFRAPVPSITTDIPIRIVVTYTEPFLFHDTRSYRLALPASGDVSVSYQPDPSAPWEKVERSVGVGGAFLECDLYEVKGKPMIRSEESKTTFTTPTSDSKVSVDTKLTAFYDVILPYTSTPPDPKILNKTIPLLWSVMVPESQRGEWGVLPQRIIIILDRTFSMRSVWKQITGPLVSFIKGLEKGTQFNIMYVDSKVTLETGQRELLGEERREEKEEWKMMDAPIARDAKFDLGQCTERRGGGRASEEFALGLALDRAIARLSLPPKDGIIYASSILVITDGRASDEQETEVNKRLLKLNESKSRIPQVTSLCLGNYSNAVFHSYLADITGGVSKLCVSKSTIQPMLTSLFLSLRRPILTDIQVGILHSTKLKTNVKGSIRLFPSRPPPMLASAPLLLVGEVEIDKYHGEDFTLILDGMRADASPVRLTCTTTMQPYSAIDRLGLGVRYCQRVRVPRSPWTPTKSLEEQQSEEEEKKASAARGHHPQLDSKQDEAPATSEPGTIVMSGRLSSSAPAGGYSPSSRVDDRKVILGTQTVAVGSNESTLRESTVFDDDCERAIDPGRGTCGGCHRCAEITCCGCVLCCACIALADHCECISNMNPLSICDALPCLADVANYLYQGIEFLLHRCS